MQAVSCQNVSLSISMLYKLSDLNHDFRLNTCNMKCFFRIPVNEKACSNSQTGSDGIEAERMHVCVLSTWGDCTRSDRFSVLVGNIQCYM